MKRSAFSERDSTSSTRSKPNCSPAPFLLSVTPSVMSARMSPLR